MRHLVCCSRRLFVLLQAACVIALCVCNCNASELNPTLVQPGGRQLLFKLPLAKLPLQLVTGSAGALSSNVSESQARSPPNATSISHTGAAAGLQTVLKAVQRLHHQQQQQQQLQDTSSDAAQLSTGLESRAVSVGFAANGGKTAAHAVAHVRQPVTGGQVAALANATAVANHASRTVAHSHSHASNMLPVGTTVAETTAEGLSDHGSTAAADSMSLSVGLGGQSTSARTTTRAAATGGSRSTVTGTAVSSAGGHDSTAHVISDSTGAAKQHSTTQTRADSITVAVGGSSATGSATSTASAEKRGAAVSQSLMESFSIFNGSHTDANSLATAHGNKGGIGWSRDKAVGIGLWSSTGATNTTSQVVATKLGLAVVTSVVRSVAAQGRLACADAIRKAAAEVATGPQINFNDVTLHLGNKVPQKCLTSYKDLTEKALIKARVRPGGAATDVQAFEQIKADISAGLAPGVQAAQGKVHKWLHTVDQLHP